LCYNEHHWWTWQSNEEMIVTPSLNPRERITEIFAELPPKQRRLARFFLDHEDVVAFASANDIGEQAGASAATVVRFCRALGYEGYTDLQSAIRAKFPQYRTFVQKLAERMASDDFTENLPAQIIRANTNNIQQTLSRVSNTDLAETVAAIVRARKIRIFGSGLSAAAAVYAEHALTVLGFSARAYIDGGVAQMMEISRLTDQDLVIVVSVWRYLRNTIEVAEAARVGGAVCLALTDSLVAPVATLADHVFIADIEGALHSRSLTSILSLIDLISAAIVAERPQESMDALQRIDALYRQNHMLRSN
jgi:DNA-binding MurR/RpiR family transcriptional regulator